MTGLAAARVVISITDRGFGPAEWSTIIAALIAALVAVAGYMLTRAWARRERRAKEFADALAAVEEYLESPYRIRRRQGSTPEVRAALAAALSDLQARIALHRAWLQVEATAVGLAYDRFVSAARADAGTQMADAWNATALTTDAEMNLKVAYPHPQADAERAKVVAAMETAPPGMAGDGRTPTTSPSSCCRQRLADRTPAVHGLASRPRYRTSDTAEHILVGHRSAARCRFMPCLTASCRTRRSRPANETPTNDQEARAPSPAIRPLTCTW
jgi:hypothetical protein